MADGRTKILPYERSFAKIDPDCARLDGLGLPHLCDTWEVTHGDVARSAQAGTRLEHRRNAIHGDGGSGEVAVDSSGYGKIEIGNAADFDRVEGIGSAEKHCELEADLLFTMKIEAQRDLAHACYLSRRNLDVIAAHRSLCNYGQNCFLDAFHG